MVLMLAGCAPSCESPPDSCVEGRECPHPGDTCYGDAPGPCLCMSYESMGTEHWSWICHGCYDGAACSVTGDVCKPDPATVCECGLTLGGPRYFCGAADLSVVLSRD
jgi:hypothetical protein